ncbi:MAG: GNAT family N-acetyltransferase [Bacteroidota bacterium]
MPDSLKIREITDRDDPVLTDVEHLFLDMYDYMQQHGLVIGLSSDGHQKWMEGMKNGLGRFGVLFVSLLNDKVTGFAHGSIRLSPDYLGNKKLGVITHIHLKESCRRQGAGNALVKALEVWFAEQHVHSVELQVLSDNLPARGFWNKLGYHDELMQCRKKGDDLR